MSSGERNTASPPTSNPYLDIRNLTRAAAAQFYRQDYWNRVWGDDLPSGPDVVTFDGANQ